MTDELKPCPFCGKTSGILFPPTCDRKTPYNPADRAFPIVRCSNCFAEAVGTDWDKSGKTAIAAWNARAPAAPEGWRDIESAPMDGSQFLVWTNRLGFAVVRHDIDDPYSPDISPRGLHLTVDDGKHGPYSIRGDYPTHWMPLPATPKAPA